MLSDKAIGPVDRERCDRCPPERVCAWDCEQGQGVLEILMGEALAEQARADAAHRQRTGAAGVARHLFVKSEE
jgi:hypothetical protein